MFVFVGIAVTATVTNGACPEINKIGIVRCDRQNLTTIPELPEGATIV